MALRGWVRPSTAQSRKAAMRMVMLAALVAGLNMALKPTEAEPTPPPALLVTDQVGPVAVLGPAPNGEGEVDAAWQSLAPALEECLYAWWMLDPSQTQVDVALRSQPGAPLQLRFDQPIPASAAPCVQAALRFPERAVELNRTLTLGPDAG